MRKPRVVVETKPEREARDAWVRHFATCFTCKENMKALCEVGKPLPAAARLEMGDGRK